MAVEEAFDTIPHSTMMRIHQLAAEDVDEARWLVKSLDESMQLRLAAGATKLRKLLESGEINQMDAALTKLVREGGADTAFNLVLTSNIDHARSNDDGTMLQLYVHMHTRMQEELEKRAAPAMGLLHRLLRTDDEGLRERVLIDFLAPKTTVAVPGGEPIQLDAPAPPKVGALEFGRAVANAVEALGSIELRGSDEPGGGTIAESVEDVRAVAKQARGVIAAHCSERELVEFTELLMPACESSPATPLTRKGLR
jgi:hypothetical protein